MNMVCRKVFRAHIGNSKQALWHIQEPSGGLGGKGTLPAGFAQP